MHMFVMSQKAMDEASKAIRVMNRKSQVNISFMRTVRVLTCSTYRPRPSPSPARNSRQTQREALTI